MYKNPYTKYIVNVIERTKNNEKFRTNNSCNVN